MTPEYRTTKEQAELMRLSAQTLREWRMHADKGPPFVKFGARVLYPSRDFEAWVKARG